MSVITQIASQKWFDQQNNGLYFSSNLGTYRASFNANTDAKVKVELEIDLFTKIDLKDIYVTATSMSGSNAFAQDIKVGDLCRIIFEDDSAYNLSINITSVSNDIIYFTVASGALPSVDFLYPTLHFYVITPTPYLRYSFGLTPDNQDPNYSSVLDGETQTYFSGNIDMSGSTTDTMNTTRKNYKTGDATVKFIGNINAPFEFAGTTYQLGQRFRITHEFIVTTYNDTQLDDILDGTKPDIFIGARTLDYCNKFEFYTDYINNPQNVKISENRLLGNVGWYNENFNKQASVFTLDADSLIMSDYETLEDVIKLSNRKKTIVSCTIKQDVPYSISDDVEVVLFIKTLPSSEKYENRNRPFDEIFSFSQVRLNSNNVNVNNGVFTNAKYNIIGISPTARNLRLDFEVDLNLLPFPYPGNSDNQNYVLGIQIGSKSLGYDNSSSVIIHTDKYDSEFDVNGLVNLTYVKHFTSPNTNFNTSGFAVLNLHAEEKVYSTYRFDTSRKIKSLKINLLAVNTETGGAFIINSQNVPLDSYLYFKDTGDSSVDLDVSQGFVNKNAFNVLKFKTVGADNRFELNVGWKVPYQTWLELKSADLVFFDKTKSFNNLNKFTANYSNKNNYIVQLALDLVLDSSEDAETENHESEYRLLSQIFNVYGYNENENGTDDFVSERTTFDEFGISIDGNLLNDSITEVRGTFTPITPPVDLTSVDFTTVSSTYTPFAHGNKFRPPSVGVAFRRGEWLNFQADATDEFVYYAGGWYYKTKGDASIYTTTTSTIQANYNMTAYYGLYSPEKYETYSISGKMYSNLADNDAIGFVIAMHVDAYGVEHTLSLLITTGGLDFGLNPNYNPNIENNESIDCMIFKGSAGDVLNTIPPKYALVYNHGKGTSKILNYVSMTASEQAYDFNDALVGDFDFEVIRTSDDIVCNCSWTINGTNYNTPLFVNLISDIDLMKFRGAKSIGFAFNSQATGGFKDVVLINPNADYYGIIRVEPKNAGTDKQIREYSTLENQATLGSNGTLFVVNALVDTTELDSYQNDITIHLAPINNYKALVTVTDLASTTTTITFKGTINGLIIKYEDTGLEQYYIYNTSNNSLITPTVSSYNSLTGVMSLTIPLQTVGTPISLKISDNNYYSYTKNTIVA